MTGYTKDENNLASGIPNRTISPETGSFGNAAKTNAGDTSEGANQDHESRPAPAAGLEGARLETDDLGERRSFTSGSVGAADIAFPESDIEPVYQQIADGGDHFDPDKRLNEDEPRKKRD
ncbi:MAG: hypothetical protein WDN45_02415 [Caulobacteraceae bacterium]